MSRELTIIISAEPPSCNAMWRNAHGHTYLSKKASDFNKIVALSVLNIGFLDWNFFRVEIIVEPKRRAGDVDNKIKTVLDAFTKCGLWKDDKYVSFVSCRFGKTSKQGRTIVKLTEESYKYED